MTLATFPLNGTTGTAVTAGAFGTSTVSTSGGTLTLQSSAAWEGTTGCRADATTAATVFGRWLFSGAATSNTASMSVRWKVPASTPAAQAVFAGFIDTGGGLVGQLIYGTSGAVFFNDKNNTQTQILSAAQATAGSSFRFFMSNVVATTTTGTVVAKAYSSGSTQVGSTVSLSNANLGTLALKGVHVGVASAVIMRSEFDDVQINDGSTADPGEYTANTTPPTITAGANQTVASSGSSQTVNLTSTATPAGGSAGIASYSWTAISWPGANTGTAAPSITNPTSQNASFSVPANNTGRYIFGVTATDLEGNTSTQATTRVFVPGTSIYPIEVTSNTGWTVSSAADLIDSNDATFVESGAPGSGGALVLRLAPLIQATSGFSLTMRSLVQTVGGTQRVELLEGATVRKNWGALGPGTSYGDQALTLTTGEMATVTSWNELDLRLTQV